MEPTAFFDFPSRGKADFRWFLIFPHEGKPIFAEFWFSPVRESWFSLNFDFPPWKIADFRRFLVFPLGGKPIFADFWFSPMRESWFSQIFVRRTPTKRDFSYFSLIVGVRSLILCVFHQSYPYESFIFLFFVDCTLYLSRFSWKLMIYSRTWVDFLENNRPFLCSKTIFDYRFIFLSWYSFSYKKGKKE